jgi:hypothetical protein
MKMPNTNLFATEQEKNPGPNEEFSLKKNWAELLLNLKILLEITYRRPELQVASLELHRVNMNLLLRCQEHVHNSRQHFWYLLQSG